MVQMNYKISKKARDKKLFQPSNRVLSLNWKILDLEQKAGGWISNWDSEQFDLKSVHYQQKKTLGRYISDFSIFDHECPSSLKELRSNAIILMKLHNIRAVDSSVNSSWLIHLVTVVSANKSAWRWRFLGNSLSAAGRRQRRATATDCLVLRALPQQTDPTFSRRVRLLS